jgi:trehalose 6-phosphate phosphatase
MSPDLLAALEGLRDVDQLLVALDFDGTISPIVAVPSAARPVPGALELLGRLGAAPATEVILVSGRSRRDLAVVSGAGGVALLIGSHGQEIGADLALTEPEGTLLAEIRANVARVLVGIPGVRVEDKPAGLAVHVRGCAQIDGEHALELIRGLAHEMVGTYCLEGKLVIELSTRPLDKGSALRSLIEAEPGRRVLFAGDDVTDESAMAVLRPQDISIRVGPGQSLARYRVPDPESMVEVLEVLVRVRNGSAQIGSR